MGFISSEEAFEIVGVLFTKHGVEVRLRGRSITICYD
jgi:hypothetical protein